MADLSDMIRQEARRQGVPENLALAVARRESGIRHRDAGGGIVRGGAGEYGVMQLMPGTAADLGVDPTTEQGNIRGGVSYLREQYERFGDWQLALAAYNAGPGNVQRGTIPTSTQQYVAAVWGDYSRDGGQREVLPGLPAPVLPPTFTPTFTPTFYAEGRGRVPDVIGELPADRGDMTTWLLWAAVIVVGAVYLTD